MRKVMNRVLDEFGRWSHRVTLANEEDTMAKLKAKLQMWNTFPQGDAGVIMGIPEIP